MIMFKETKMSKPFWTYSINKVVVGTHLKYLLKVILFISAENILYNSKFTTTVFNGRFIFISRNLSTKIAVIF